MTGGLLSFGISVFEHYRGRSLTAASFTIVAFAAFMWGAFLAWRNERVKLEAEEQKRGRPDVTAEFGIDDRSRKWVLYLHNSSSFPAVGVHIDDIKHGVRVLRFLPPASIRQNVDYAVKCGILLDGWHETNDIASLFSGDKLIGMSPIFNLRIHFSSLDSATAQKHWILSAQFWYDLTQQKMILSNQRIESLR